MLIALRSTLTIILGAIAAFCGFGFLAGAEARPEEAANSFRLLYGTAGLGCVGAIAAVWLVKAKGRRA